MILKLSRCVIRILVDDPREPFWELGVSSSAANDNDSATRRDRPFPSHERRHQSFRGVRLNQRNCNRIVSLLLFSYYVDNAAQGRFVCSPRAPQHVNVTFAKRTREILINTKYGETRRVCCLIITNGMTFERKAPLRSSHGSVTIVAVLVDVNSDNNSSRKLVAGNTVDEQRRLSYASLCITSLPNFDFIHSTTRDPKKETIRRRAREKERRVRKYVHIGHAEITLDDIRAGKISRDLIGIQSDLSYTRERILCSVLLCF